MAVTDVDINEYDNDRKGQDYAYAKLKYQSTMQKTVPFET